MSLPCVLSGKSFNFTPFNSKLREYYPNIKQPTNKFLEWFIGFTEGEGSFILAKRGDLSFVITQSTVDVQILNYIRDNLGPSFSFLSFPFLIRSSFGMKSFGKVIMQSKKSNTHRFIIQDLKNLHLICLLFNGNMVFPSRQARFLTFFYERLLRKNLNTITPLDTRL